MVVLSALACLADSVVTVIGISALNTTVTYQAFCEALLSVFCRGVRTKVHSHLYIEISQRSNQCDVNDRGTVVNRHETDPL